MGEGAAGYNLSRLYDDEPAVRLVPMLRNLLMILFVTCSTLSGQMLLKHATVSLAARQPALRGAEWMLATFQAPQVWGAILIQGVGFLVWLVVISRMKLGLAFALAGASLYLLMGILGWSVYGERLAPLQWVGIGLISAGVLLLALFSPQA